MSEFKFLIENGTNFSTIKRDLVNFHFITLFSVPPISPIGAMAEIQMT